MAAASAAADGDSFSVEVVIALRASSSPSLSIDNKKRKKKKNDHHPIIKEEKKLMMSKDKDMDGDADGSISDKKKMPSSSSSSSSLEKFQATASASCSFPMRRAWRLVRGEAGNADNRTTHEAVFLINKASEMFLQRFAQEAYSIAPRDRKRSITYHHLSSMVCNRKRYEFLSDFVPEKVKAEDALKARALAET